MTAIFDVVGIFGGYLVSVKLFGLSQGTYFGEMQTFVDLVGHHGRLLEGPGLRNPRARGSAPTRASTAATAPEGVARATTEAVVLSSVLILVCDYILGSVLP